jgi:hypothetical protein
MGKSSRDSELEDIGRFLVAGVAGDYVFREGDPGTEMYIIEEGEIEILKTYGPTTRRLTTLEAGDFFGEMEFLEEQRRGVSARALTPFRLLRIDQSTFDQLVLENPEIAVRMLRKLSRRLREREEADLRAVQIAREVLGEDEGGAAPAEALPRPGTLVRALIVEESSGTEFVLPESAEVTIGRIDRATGFTPDIDLTPLDTQRTISRRHARISRGQDGFYLREEMGASNGTFLNGRRLPTGKPERLQDGDRIDFGQVRAVFRCG